jgi:cyclic lactone autoinducer peptide
MIMKASEKLASKAIRRITSGSEYGWPPVCMGLFYQPERPVSATPMVKTCKKEESGKEKD